MWRGVLAVLILMAELGFAKKYNLTVGYLPCISGELHRQGLTISGALSIALEEVNNSTQLLPDVDLLLKWNDTKCDTATATRLLTDMISAGVVAFFGPEGRCAAEANVSHSSNLPMISYRCSDFLTSKPPPTFARLEPSGATKAMISLLRYYRWNKFSIIYEESWSESAFVLKSYAKKNNMTVNHLQPVLDVFDCCEQNMPCCKPGHWYRLIQTTKEDTRIYVFLGSVNSLVEMMSAMEALGMFSKGEYMVLFVDMMAYSSKEALNYLTKIEDRVSTKMICPNTVEFKKRAQSLLVVVSSEPATSYDKFTDKVRLYNAREPFKFPSPFNVFNTFVSIYAAYLYDSLKLYATALDEIIIEETRHAALSYEKLMTIATNGTRIIEKMKSSSPYRSISGMTIRLNERAESEGNFPVLAFKPTNYRDGDVTCTYNMIPVGHFQQSIREFPEYILNPRLPIDWSGSVKPEDEPLCGFRNKKCSMPNHAQPKSYAQFELATFLTYMLLIIQA